MPSVAIVTSCTQRKAGRHRVDVAELPEVTSLYRLAQSWRRALREAHAETPVRDLYRGRSTIDTAWVADAHGTSWYVVSAGLGLVRSDHVVPAYECTVSSGSDLCRRLSVLDCSTAEWWNAVTHGDPAPLSRVIAGALTLLALPSSYLRMVHDDLAQVSRSRANSLRIFTSTAGALCVPDHLRECVMPYDERLESVSGFAGTRSDFAQRALRHFVEVLQATPMPLKEAREAVSGSLAHRRRRPSRIGQRMTDDQLRQVLTSQWTRHSGRSTKLLRYLRDEAGISCEQKRFRRLWQELSAKVQA